MSPFLETTAALRGANFSTRGGVPLLAWAGKKNKKSHEAPPHPGEALEVGEKREKKGFDLEGQRPNPSVAVDSRGLDFAGTS